MLNPLAKIRKVISARIPGTSLNLAQQKRAMERELRAQGYSRKHAMTASSAHFKKGA